MPTFRYTATFERGETMKCPVDGETLVMTDRSGVEIDYCPKCRGVWLDRGELDKIIERSAPQVAPAQAPVGRGEPYQAPPSYAERRHSDPPRKKKKKGFLDEIFDF
jgi:hypothetical protein